MTFAPFSRFRRNDLMNHFNIFAKLTYCALTMASSEGGAFSDDKPLPNAPSKERSKPIVRNRTFRSLIYECPWGWTHLDKWDILKFFKADFSKPHLPSQEVLEKEFPVKMPDYHQISRQPEGIRATWIGHATTLVQFDGVSLLTDPMFSERASVNQNFGPKRFRPVPCTIQDLKRNGIALNAVVISHNHYDHLDYDSVLALNNEYGEELWWYVPLGLESWMRSAGCKNVKQLDWWDEVALPSNPKVKFVLTPAQHWSKRSPLDDNKTLWGSWTVVGPRHRFFFAGDTGHCPGFKQIGDEYGPIDLAAIPIGAYKPIWFMKNHHCGPEDAISIHKDIKAKHSLAVHWGTFYVGCEAYNEPITELAERIRKEEVKEKEFVWFQHGESREFQTQPGSGTEEISHGLADVHLSPKSTFNNSKVPPPSERKDVREGSQSHL